MNIEDPWADLTTSAHRDPSNSADARRLEMMVGAGDVRVGRMLREGDQFVHAGWEFLVLHTPGHQRGEISLWQPQRRLAFVGDTVQAGADVSGNWLGLFEDVQAQRESLRRLADLDPAWLFRGHREPVTGDGVGPDIAAAAKRLDDIEAVLLAALEEHAVLADHEAVRIVFDRVVGIKVDSPRPYALTGVRSMLAYLARQGRARRRGDLAWEKVE